MKALVFPAQLYIEHPVGVWTYQKKEDSVIGLLELLYTGLYKSPYQELDRLKTKTHKKILKKIREVTMFKDLEKDSRVSLSGPQTILLEENEFDLLKMIFAANKFSTMATDDVDTLWDIIDDAKEYVPPKPVLVAEEKVIERR